MSLIAFGTIALDNIKTPSGVRENLLGGSASHFAMSARLFTKVRLASVIGEDFPSRHLRFFKQKGIDIDPVERLQGKSFVWHGEYKDSDLNTAITLATELGVLADYRPSLPDCHKNIKNVFLANFDPDNQQRFLALMKSPDFVGMDTMNLWINNNKNSVKKLMRKVDLFVVNDGEARALAEEMNLIKAAKKLRKMGPRFVVIKKGEHGVLFYCDEFMFSFPAYPVEKVVDPTGAGDTFAGGLMGCISRARKINERLLRKAVVYASCMASFNVEGFGISKTAALSLQEVEERKSYFINFMRV